MKRLRIYELAKEWGVASQTILEQLRKGGSKATTVHNTITEEEAAKVKSLIGLTPPPVPPVPAIGQQRVISERVVTQSTDGATAAVATHEQVVEQRVQTGVIRRRTTRVELPQEMTTVVDEQPVSAVTPEQGAPTPSEETPPIAFDVPVIDEEVVPFAVSTGEDALARAVSVDTTPHPDAVSTSPASQASAPAQPGVVATTNPSPRVLGRIDLRKTVPAPPLSKRSTSVQPTPAARQGAKPASGTPLPKKPSPVTPLESRKPQRPRAVVVHIPAETKREAGEERFLRGL
jgi:hypothetical protein